jgi:pimeloyl-ACP methyl ester carboxylesterase
MNARFGTWLAACVLSLVTSAEAAFAAPPLEIAKQGVFFVGGRYQSTPSGTVMDGQMYVQFQMPAHKHHRYPIVLIHGHGQSGVNFISTPDGREGWADLFLRQGYAVYVVDQPLRGRSPYHADLDGPLSPFSAEIVSRVFTNPQASPVWPQAVMHDQWPGPGVPGNAAFDQFYASELDSSSDDQRIDELNRDADVALLERIGPAIVLTHSRSGPFGWLVADARPDLVKAVVAIEPWGPPFRDTSPKASGLKRPWGLTVAPLAFAPPTADPSELSPREDASPPGPTEDRCWLMGGPSRTLPHLVGIPILIVTGEASYHARYDRCTSAFLTRAGVENNWLRLGSVGIHGNGHMMMLERNNAQIVDAIEVWLATKVDRRSAVVAAKAH